MSIERVKESLKIYNRDKDIIILNESSATVALAASALNIEEKRIAKTLSFYGKDNPILIVCAGDAKIDNAKFRQEFGLKAQMIALDEVEKIIGHQAGGVCPFGINDNIDVFCDISLKRFETVFPACGSSNSAIELTKEELYQFSNAIKWIDVCKNWE